MSQDSIVIFRSFIEALQQLPPELYKEASVALYDYALNGTLPTAESRSPTALALFYALKPQMDYNIKRQTANKTNAPKGGNPNFRKGKPNPYYNRADETAEEDNLDNEDNPNITQDNPRDNRGITQDNPKSINTKSINNIVVGDVNAHTREGENFEDFLTEFFKEEHRAQIEALCMNLHVSPDELRKLAQDVTVEWVLTKQAHPAGYNEAARHLINHIRIKHSQQKRQEYDAANPNNRRAATAAAPHQHAGMEASTKPKKPFTNTL